MTTLICADNRQVQRTTGSGLRWAVRLSAARFDITGGFRVEDLTLTRVVAEASVVTPMNLSPGAGHTIDVPGPADPWQITWTTTPTSVRQDFNGLAVNEVRLMCEWPADGWSIGDAHVLLLSVADGLAGRFELESECF